MAQAFTSTEPSNITVEEIFPVRDIVRNGSKFTDGVGDISPEMAAAIAKSLTSGRGGKRRFHATPCAYQFRSVLLMKLHAELYVESLVS